MSDLIRLGALGCSKCATEIPDPRVAAIIVLPEVVLQLSDTESINVSEKLYLCRNCSAQLINEYIPVPTEFTDLNKHG